MRLILASSSPRRQQLLLQAGADFEVMKPQIDESRCPGEPFIAYVERLSRQKAAAVIGLLGDEPTLVIAADTIVALGGELLGKPRDAAEARRMLRGLRNRAHQVYTAFTLCQPPRMLTRHVRTDVHMRDYSDAEIEAYIASGDPFDKAGAYAIQNADFHPVARIQGSYTNVVGLPLDELQAALTELGLAWPPDSPPMMAMRPELDEGSQSVLRHPPEAVTIAAAYKQITGDMMTTTTLQATANKLAAAGKGVLAADMPRWRLEEQLEQQGITPDDGSYRAWCELLFTTPQLSEHISGVIMADDALHIDAGAGRSLVELVRQKGMIPGITPSKGLVKLAGTRGELIESGLDGLRERLSRYAQMGFGFSKWRSPIRIGDGRPSDCAIAANVYVMGQFAALSQEAGIVPMIEPEVELVGNHTIERCFEVTEGFLRRSFESLYLHGVELEGTLVKASMVLSGADCPMQADVDTVAELTVRVLRRAVPAAIPGITFLSGGQSDFKATAHLNAMNASYETPWALTFSYARALQRQPMALWRSRAENVPAAQAAFKHRAKMNALASIGLWTESLETQMTPG